jgi:hypothetical protein
VNGSHVPVERSLGMTDHILAVLTAISVIGLSSCAIKPIPLTTDEVRSRAQEDRAVLTKDQEPVSGPIDLYEAMARALKYRPNSTCLTMPCCLVSRRTLDSTAAIITREELGGP